MIDARLPAFLACAWERPGQPYYSAAAYTLARQLGDTETMRWALELGAADYKPEPPIRMQTEEDQPVPVPAQVIQLRLFDMEEAA